MTWVEELEAFYRKHLPDAKTDLTGKTLSLPCPFCAKKEKQPGKENLPGDLLIDLDQDSLFFGHFRCTVNCIHGGHAIEFARSKQIDLGTVPGFDPEAEPAYKPPTFPFTHRNGEMYKLARMCSSAIRQPFHKVGLSDSVLDLFHVGYNGRLFVYPYLQEDGNCYSLRGVSFAGKFDQPLWQGDEQFTVPPHNLFNTQDISRADGGVLIVTVGERNAMALKEAGLNVVAIPTYADESCVTGERLQFTRHVVLMMNHDVEGYQVAQTIGLRIGFKARLVRWDTQCRKGYGVADLLNEQQQDFKEALFKVLYDAEPLSPLPSARREYASFVDYVESHKGRDLLGLRTCFDKLNVALDGLRGLNVLGAQPKAGKSTIFMQLASSLADEQSVPVIYYDFENGRQKIYTRTLSRLARLSERQLNALRLSDIESHRRDQALERFRKLLKRFKVVTDRKINPDLMRKQIDFLRSETDSMEMLLVVDSLHKLPFSRLSERRSGIDEWLRHMETIRDEQRVTFLVISELGRSLEGGYSETPDLASFKETGDIEYTADNALVMTTSSSVYDKEAESHDVEQDGSQPGEDVSSDRARRVELYLVASREMSPGHVASYQVEYPYWSFREL